MLLRLVLVSVFATLACNADDTAKLCVASDLVGQCPVGSNPVLGAAASDGCGGTFDGDLVSNGASVSGQCNSQGSCEFLCQFTVPCSCGVATITKDQIVCSECPNQSCGDSRCEGTERAACEPGAGAGCFACPEDCAGPSCGDGDCSGAENPRNCPQDCAGTCEPNAKQCLGAKTRICRADGSGFDEFDCAGIALVCAEGNCVQPNVCGNKVCDGGETPASCPGDCSTACQPNATRCSGTTLHTCNANGSAEASLDCAALSQVCVAGECRPAGVCGNGLCESGEDDASCPGDCAAQCGNHVCENGEDRSCPSDCVVCGDHVCGAGEITGCPQDCGICVPSEKQCLGKKLRVCNANGTVSEDVDCEGFGLTCGGGDCVPADVCGNGLCDGAETAASCAADCGVVCGDSECEPGEAFRTCAVDCDPECGDGTCEGREDFATCAFDCLTTCGNGACDALEDRANCPSDCGYCGDGECQDGAETSNINPPANLETCVLDCVVSGCQQAADCDDGIPCTRDGCVAQKCVYTADDDLCIGDDKCIKFNGCCPDADGDGYADQACGGSDCDDDDKTAHPGATEICGGGDKNCNGTHAPRLTPAKRLTNTPSAKRNMKVMQTGSAMVIGWTGTPSNRRFLELVTVSYDLAPGTPVTVAEVEVDPLVGLVAMDWSAAKGAVGVLYPDPRGDDGYFTTAHGAWIATDGAVLGLSEPVPTETCGSFCSYPIYLPFGLDGVSHGNDVIFPTVGMKHGPEANCPTQWQVGRWARLGVTSSVIRDSGDACDQESPGATRLTRLKGAVSGLYSTFPPQVPQAGTIVTFDPDATRGASKVPLDHPSGSGACTLGEDGELLVLACSKDGTTWYHRATQGGGVFYSAAVQTGDITPLGIGKSNGNGPVRVGVATRDPANNLWFFERDQEGEPILAPAIISGGGEISSAWVVHDGIDFEVIWLAKTGGFEQVYGQRITCE